MISQLMEEVHGQLNMADKVALLIIYLYSFLGKTKKICYEENSHNRKLLWKTRK